MEQVISVGQPERVIEPRRVRALLDDLPEVRDAAVVSGREGLTCYLVLDLDAADLSRLRQEDWRHVFDSIYDNDVVVDEDVDVTAFSSAYTRRPFPGEDMREWADATVAQIRPRLPDRPRVLEIGCGTGLVLRRLAPGSERYAVVDFSASALARLRDALPREEFAQVEYHHAEAGDLPSGLRDFDAVVIAQVAQYFPSEDYLRRVLTGALERVRPTGLVYVDVRSLPLLETFHVSVERFADPDAPAGEILTRARHHLLAEDELVVHPSFFLQFARSSGVDVRVEPRRGHRVKELSAYRYDVLLSPEPGAGTTTATEWLPWGAGEWTTGRLRTALDTGRPPVLAFTGIPHGLLTEDVTAHHRTARRAGRPGPRVPPGTPVLPDDIRRVGAETGYRVFLSGASGDPEGTFDAWLAGSAALVPPPAVAATPGAGPLTGDPSRREAQWRAVRRIGALLDSGLPGPREPVTVVAVPRLPEGTDRGGPAPEAPPLTI